MIQEWNVTVGHDNLVYMLGDVAFCNAAQATQIVSRLNGRKILIAGNHDHKNLKHQEFRDCFEDVRDYLEINHDGNKICMFHYPIFDHNQAGRGSIMLHGHRHGKPTGLSGRVMDVGMDATGRVVISLDEVVKKMLNSISELKNDIR